MLLTRFVTCAMCMAILILTTGRVEAGIVTLDFDDFPPPPGGYGDQGSQFTSRGFTFREVTGDLAIVDDRQDNVPNAGSNFLIADASPDASFTLRVTDSTVFDLLSLRAAEGRNTASGFYNFSATGISVVGTIYGGGTVSTTLNFDGIAQNSPLDFQTFVLSGFTQLTSVKFTGIGGPMSGYSYSLDDIKVQKGPIPPVPEPSSIALLGIGGASLVSSLFRRRKMPTPASE